MEEKIMAQYVEIEQSRTEQSQTQPKMKPRRNKTFLHALAFVAGFTLVFVTLGAAAGLLGQSLNRFLPVMQRFGAILLFIFALVTLADPQIFTSR